MSAEIVEKCDYTCESKATAAIIKWTLPEAITFVATLVECCYITLEI